MDAVTSQLRTDQNTLEQAHNALQKVTDRLRESWRGRAGAAAAAAHEALRASIVAKHAASDRAISACLAYRDAHEDVKSRSLMWLDQLETARRTIGSADAMMSGPQTAPDLDELIAMATRSKTTALAEEAEALEKLAALYTERVDARDRFRHAVEDITRVKGGAVIAARAVDDPRPKAPSRHVQGPNDGDVKRIRELVRRANDSVWSMAGAWVTGKGPRGFVWTESDPFTQVFTRSASAKRAVAAIEKDLRDPAPKKGGEIDAKPEDLPRDLVTILNGGGAGNLPEAFIGSFAYEYTVTEVDPDGMATVKIHAWNDTTIESATRIPGSRKWPLGPHYLGPYASMRFIRDVLGSFQPIRQDITWTATVRMP